jgi:hypothetical protein
MQRVFGFLRARPIGTLAASAGTGLVMSRVTTVTNENDGDSESGRKNKPSHWANDEGTKFVNPWPSFRDVVCRATLLAG